MALRPDWVDPDGLATVSDMSAENTGLDVDLAGAVVQTYGAWAPARDTPQSSGGHRGTGQGLTRNPGGRSGARLARFRPDSRPGGRL